MVDQFASKAELNCLTYIKTKLTRKELQAELNNGAKDFMKHDSNKDLSKISKCVGLPSNVNGK